VVLGVKEGEKIQGLQAVATGAAAGLIAQAVTTPVRLSMTYFLIDDTLAITLPFRSCLSISKIYHDHASLLLITLKRCFHPDIIIHCSQLDVVRTRIMTRSSLSELESEGSEGQNEKNRKLNTNNPIEELINIVEAEGTSSLFKGLLPRATRALASGAIQFGTYEFTQNALLKR
jgi:hypothetical protein